MIKSLFTVCVLVLGISSKAQTWVQTSLTPGGVSCLAVNGNSLYAGTGNGVEMTTDYGVTWVPRNTGLTTFAVTSIAIENSKMIAGTANGGVFLSNDGGANWSAINGSSSLGSIAVLTVLISGSNMFAGTVTGAGDGIYMTSNNGASWSKVNGGTGLNGNNIRSLGKSGSNLLAGTNGGGIYMSSDNGLTWTQSTTTGSNNGYILSFASNASKTYAGSGGQVLVSTNNGSTFSVANGTINCGFYGLALNGNDIYAATQTCYGPYLSNNNGTTFNYFFNGLSNYDLTSIVICGSNLFISSTVDGVWKFPITIATSVNETLSENNIELFPNPISNQFTVKPSNNNEPVSVSISNIQGQVLKTIELKDSESIIDISSLNSGVYIIKLSGKNFSKTQKISKL